MGLILNDFQSGARFYCRRDLKGDIFHVNHFIPWSRYPVDLGHNFVLAHACCNSKKSDRLAALEHLDQWCGYQERNAKALTAEFNQRHILNDFQSSLRIANCAQTQTFEVQGLTWLRNDELQPLTGDWNSKLRRLFN